MGAPVSLDEAIGRYKTEALPLVPTADRARHTLRLFLEWAGDRALGTISVGDIGAFRAWRRPRGRRKGKDGRIAQAA